MGPLQADPLWVITDDDPSSVIIGVVYPFTCYLVKTRTHVSLSHNSLATPRQISFISIHNNKVIASE